MKKIKQELLFAKNDLVFKKIFGDIKHKNILISFLQAILNLPEDEYKEITIQNPDLLINKLNDKHCILDIKLTTKSGKIIDIEIQVDYFGHMKERLLLYTADMLKEQISSGGNYEEIKKVITIVIAVNHNLIHDSKEYHNCYVLHDKHTDSTFTDLIEVNTLEIKKLPKDNDKTELWAWLKFLNTNNEEELNVISKKSTNLKEAVCVLKELSQDEETRFLARERERIRMDEYDRVTTAEKIGLEKGIKQGIKQGLQQGIEKGLQQGIERGKLELIKSLLQIGVDLNTISKSSGLSEEKIKQFIVKTES